MTAPVENGTALAGRYRKQMLLPGIGPEGQKKISSSKVTIIGCGALGTIAADTLVRAGIGKIVLADRDFIELDNLHRQTLFDEDDIAGNKPKAVAAAGKLSRINTEVTVEARVFDINQKNISGIIRGTDCVVDATDNFETRFLINYACHRLNIPWVYGGVVGTQGMTMPILPGKTACFRCLVRDIPGTGSAETCDTAGVIMPAVSVISSLQCTEVLKILTGSDNVNAGTLTRVDVWEGSWDRFRVDPAPGCPLCSEGRYQFLDSPAPARAESLCGRNSVQLTPGSAAPPDFKKLSEKLERLGRVVYNEHLLKFKIDSFEIVLFRDGRAIIGGTSNPMEARSLYSKYVGA